MVEGTGITGPLSGIKILDCTIWQNGPSATVILSDLGAEVIKVEDPVTGDPSRGIRYPGTEDGVSGYFEAVNRNKRSITLDLKSPEGRDIFLRLAAESDVVVQNFRFGVVEKLKIAYPDVLKVNPTVIYASVTGFGREGPDAKVGVFDILGQARSGALKALSYPGVPITYNNAFGLADQCGGMMLAQAITAALFARERTGEGQELEISQLGSMMVLQQMGLSRSLLNGISLPPTNREQPVNPLFTTYECAAGEWIALGGLQPDRYWAAFCGILDLPEVASDPRFGSMETRTANSRELVGVLDKAFAKCQRADLLKQFADAGIPCAPVNSYQDVANDVQVLANEYIIDLPHPVRGSTRVINMPIRFSKTPARARSAAPQMGQDTEAVLLELGLTWDDISALHEKKIL